MELNVRGVESNRLERDGMEPQAMEWNAIGMEGTCKWKRTWKWNGMEWNGTEWNG